MTRLAIIADDLSGALDSAAPFASFGHRTVVALSPAALGKALATGAQIVAVSTDSREIDPSASRQRVAAALAQVPAGTRLFKKIDSRLKGNIEAELTAFSFEKALVVPAIPAFGRWTRDGFLGGFGVDGPIDIAARLGRHATKSVFPDTVTQDDVRAALDCDGHDLLVGARALAEALAERMGQGEESVKAHRGPVFFVIGSSDPITLEQVVNLRASYPDALHVSAPNGVLSGTVQRSGHITILQAMPGSDRIAPAAVAQNLAAAVETLDPPPGTLLIISGGATAQVILDHMRVKFIEVLGEVLPGLPLADVGRFKLITKSGGFGEPDAFVKVLARLGMDE